MSTLSNLKKGLCFIISAPAGTGKTTLVKMLTANNPSIVVNVSYTTRQPRVGEMDGRDYHFISEEKFKEKIESNDFLEYVQLYDYLYGSSKKWVEDRQNEGKHVILVIDTQGAILLKNKIDAVYIFISPPSLEELKKRLSSRETETSESLKKRLDWALKEMDAMSLYDYNIINDDLLSAFEVLKSIIIAESHRIPKTIGP